MSETWLDGRVEERLTSVPNYKLIRLDRQVKRNDGSTKSGGGVAIYCKKHLDLDANKFCHFNISNKDLEIQWVLLKRPNTKNIIIGNVYRPPDGNANEAFKLINDTMIEIDNIHKFEILLLGDFNIDYKNDKVPIYKAMHNFSVNHGVKQIIERPTRYSKNKSSIIDLAFSNIKYSENSGVWNYNLSDHKLIYIIKKKKRNIKTERVHKGRSYANCNYDELVNFLERANTRYVTEILDPNECWDELLRVITAAADALCPIHEIQIRDCTAPFLNKELLELQKDRDYFVNKADLSGEPGDRFIANCMITRARSEVRRAKAEYYKSQAIKYLKNPRKFWSELHNIESKSQVEINNISSEVTGVVFTAEELPGEVNKYFTGIGPALANKFPNIENTEKRFKPLVNGSTFELDPINGQDIRGIIKEFSQFKSSGLDNLSSAFVMTAISILVEKFTHLYNIIIETGIFPDAWKVATITPIPKVSIPKTCNELRPISILPLPGRIIEKYINNKIQDFLESTNYLHQHQYGFRKNKSTTQAVATLMDRLLEGMDRGEYSITIYLDFKKAFDTVDHNILIWKLKRAGIGNSTCKLLANYLKGRKQLTKIGKKISDKAEVKTGVPQGSTLGPLLFLIYANDFLQISDLPLYTQFADDTTLTLVHKDIKWLEAKLNAILEMARIWFLENKLTINTTKTEYVIYATKYALNNMEDIHLIIGDSEISRVKQYKYLGTVLDCKLTGEQQVSNLNQQVAIKLKTFNQIRRFMTEKTAILIYKTTILPIIDYNDIIYGLLTENLQMKLQRLQNRALRTVFWGQKLTNNEMHEKANVNCLKIRQYEHMMMLMHTRAKNELYQDNITRITRQATAVLLKVPQARLDKYLKAPICKGSSEWNKLPTQIREIKTRLGFKMKLRKYEQAGQTD